MTVADLLHADVAPGSATGFELRLQGRETASGFCRIGGLESASGVTETPEVDLRGSPYIRKTAGPQVGPGIVLARPLDASLVLWRWREVVLHEGADAARLDGHIALLDGAGREVALFRFEQGWPHRYRVSGFDDPRGPVLEEIEICHDGLGRIR